ncbi:DUF4136 domain-containing protein [Fontibacter flavus]|uniref:DUF4136 domain-containing protein n=1 Tax=Fontibacter flavus TaxID=654838 RepID=A0ABV6FVW8_9BACT
MKTSIILFAALLIMSACMSQRDYIAEYDFNYSGNFKRYKTFGFVGNPFPSDSLDYYQTIENTISTRLGSQGFRFEDEKPDLLINYKIFQDPVKYRGYDQPNFDFWLDRRSENVDMEKVMESDDREKDENYKKVKYVENNGMLVIFVIDNKRGNTIWQGYTAASFDLLSSDSQRELTRATYRVMDQFRILTRN